MLRSPQTAKGVLISLAVLSFLVVLYYGSGLAVLMGAVVIATLAYAVYIVGYRADKYLKNELG